VLRLATSDAAAALGIGDRTGRIAEGMEADIVFFASNPLGDPASLRKPALILSDGTARTPREILGTVGWAASAPRTGQQ
jgi:imidazolonepropionase-like amidohydrolase